jgi:hypothetical protein
MIQIMSKETSGSRGQGTRAAKKKGGMVIGHTRFSKISAVEGLTFTEAMSARRDEFDRAGASAEKRREAIIKAHKR